MKRHILTALAASLLCVAALAQSAKVDVSKYANDYARPLKEVLADVAKMFDVKINAGSVPDSLLVEQADFKIRPWDVEQTLEALLWPVGLNAEWNWNNGNPAYSVSAYRHSRRNPWEGEKMLEYLSSKYDDKASWESRKEILRADMYKAVGLDKYPEHFSGNVLVSKKRKMTGYQVQDFALEILPGMYSFGAIYWPAKTPKGGTPLVVNPHGHSDQGHASSVVQIRAAMQARMGCIAITFSMFCNGPSPQFPTAYHKTGIAQPYNVLCAERILDWALSFKEVDPARVAVTGCSGGASQTMFVTALDDRVTLAIPVVMMSSYFLGGCACESGTRIHLSGGGTSNVEIATMAAPRPMLIISDGGDWTAMNPEIEIPFVKRTYGFYGASDSIEHVHLPMEGHNYNETKRQAAYGFLSRKFGLKTDGLLKEDGSFDESPVTVEKLADMSIWNSCAKPEGFITDFDDAIAAFKWEKNN